jgi:dihydroorotase/N-acyl-D-amino-acid deacylase
MRLWWLLLCAACAHEPYDLIIRGGEVLDGTGGAARRVDVGVRGDRIETIGDLHKEMARHVIEAKGMVVAPGFIDVQGQSDKELFTDGEGQSHIRQGITTEVLGEGGLPGLWTEQTTPERERRDIEKRFGITIDWHDFESYLRRFEKSGTAINIGAFASGDLVRERVLGHADRAPTAEELAREEAVVDEAMRQGAFGLATALQYPPIAYAKTDELIALAKVAAKYGGIYISHVRNESAHGREAIAEAIEIGDRAGLPVVIYHLKTAGRDQWGQMRDRIAQIEAARARGLEVSACMYPYTGAGTGLAACLPPWAHEGGGDKIIQRIKDPAMRARIRKDVETDRTGWDNLIAEAGWEGIQIAGVRPEADASVQGKRISEIAKLRGADPWDMFWKILTENRATVFCFYHVMTEEDVKTAMRAPFVSFGSDSSAVRPDGILGRTLEHPRGYGTFPRVLAKYVRDEKVLTMPDAVRKMTSLAAAQLGIRERGTIKEGYFADLVVFDPIHVQDTATFEHPHSFPHGIEYVVVNGVIEIDKEKHTGKRAGRALFGPGYEKKAAVRSGL